MTTEQLQIISDTVTGLAVIALCAFILWLFLRD